MNLKEKQITWIQSTVNNDDNTTLNTPLQINITTSASYFKNLDTNLNLFLIYKMYWRKTALKN